MKPKVLTITEAAKRLNVTRQAIAHAVKNGKIKAERVGHIWLINEEDLVHYKPIRRPGRPKKGAEE